jgi:hypothetical protein
MKSEITRDRNGKSTFDPDLANRVNKEYENMPFAETPKQEEIPSEKPGFIYVPSIKLYIGTERVHKGLSWYGAQTALARKGYFMPTIYQFKEFVKLLKTDHLKKEEEKVTAAMILDDILGAREPERGEWLDACFDVSEYKNQIIYNHRFCTTGAFLSETNERMEPHITDIQTSEIDLDDWLVNANSQGLPKSTAREGRMLFWKPVNASVARFGIDKYRNPVLSCADNEIADPNIGVRMAYSREAQ